MRILALLVIMPLAAVPRAAGQSKDKPKDAPPKPLYALQLAADAGKTTKLTIRGLRVDTATDVRVGDPKSSGKVIGKGRKAPVSMPMSADVVGDTEVDIEVTL